MTTCLDQSQFSRLAHRSVLTLDPRRRDPRGPISQVKGGRPVEMTEGILAVPQLTRGGCRI